MYIHCGVCGMCLYKVVINDMGIGSECVCELSVHMVCRKLCHDYLCWLLPSNQSISKETRAL